MIYKGKTHLLGHKWTHGRVDKTVLVAAYTVKNLDLGNKLENWGLGK